MLKNTDTRQQVLAFIRRYRSQHGGSPSFAEIATELRLKSLDTVTYHVKKLLAAGLLTKASGKARGLIPTEEPPPKLKLQVYQDPDLNKVLAAVNHVLAQGGTLHGPLQCVAGLSRTKNPVTLYTQAVVVPAA